jgi:3-dehydroquinate dehydratase
MNSLKSPGFSIFAALHHSFKKTIPWEEVTKKPQKVKDSRAHSAKAALQKQPNKRNL